MNPYNVRVIPDYLKLSKQLQNDMLQTAYIIRDALYSIEFRDSDDLNQFERLCNALEVLDFPHWVPIDNSVSELKQELNRLKQEIEISDTWIELAVQHNDIWKEIERRKGGE